MHPLDKKMILKIAAFALAQHPLSACKIKNHHDQGQAKYTNRKSSSALNSRMHIIAAKSNLTEQGFKEINRQELKSSQFSSIDIIRPDFDAFRLVGGITDSLRDKLSKAKEYSGLDSFAGSEEISHLSMRIENEVIKFEVIDYLIENNFLVFESAATIENSISDQSFYIIDWMSHLFKGKKQPFFSHTYGNNYYLIKNTESADFVANLENQPSIVPNETGVEFFEFEEEVLEEIFRAKFKVQEPSLKHVQHFSYSEPNSLGGSRPKVVHFFPDGDHNGAFADSSSAISLLEISERYDLDFFRVESMDEIDQVMKNYDDESLEFIVIGGHANADSQYFQNGWNEDVPEYETRSISKESAAKLSNSGIIIRNGCSTCKIRPFKRSLAEQDSKTLGRPTIGIPEPGRVFRTGAPGLTFDGTALTAHPFKVGFIGETRFSQEVKAAASWKIRANVENMLRSERKPRLANLSDDEIQRLASFADQRVVINRFMLDEGLDTAKLIEATNQLQTIHLVDLSQEQMDLVGKGIKSINNLRIEAPILGLEWPNLQDLTSKVQTKLSCPACAVDIGSTPAKYIEAATVLKTRGSSQVEEMVLHNPQFIPAPEVVKKLETLTLHNMFRTPNFVSKLNSFASLKSVKISYQKGGGPLPDPPDGWSVIKIDDLTYHYFKTVEQPALKRSRQF